MQLSSFLTYVKYDFKRSDKDSEITQAYNDSILAVAIKMPHNGYKYQSYIALVANQEDYPLPSNIIHIIHPIRLLEGSTTNDSGKPLEKITKQEYDEKYINPNRSSPSTGEPDDYCIYAGSFLVGPIPGSTEVTNGNLLETDWTKQPTDQSADSDTPGLEDSWREVLKWMTLARVNAGVGLYEEAKHWESLYQDSLTKEPIGLFRDLLNVEKDKEGESIATITPNTI